MQCRRRPPLAAALSATQFFTQPEEGGGGEGGEHCQVIPGQLPHPSRLADSLWPGCWTLESSTELVRRKGGAQLLVVEDHVQWGGVEGGQGPAGWCSTQLLEYTAVARRSELQHQLVTDLVNVLLQCSEIKDQVYCSTLQGEDVQVF